jgi:hypothetical protein
MRVDLVNLNALRRTCNQEIKTKRGGTCTFLKMGVHIYMRQLSACCSDESYGTLSAPGHVSHNVGVPRIIKPASTCATVRSSCTIIMTEHLVTTDLLIVGAGPAGASLACFLSSYGTCGRNIVRSPGSLLTPSHARRSNWHHHCCSKRYSRHTSSTHN